LQERLAKLAGGVAVINVGRGHRTENERKKARVEERIARHSRSYPGRYWFPGGGVGINPYLLPPLDKLKLEGVRKWR